MTLKILAPLVLLALSSVYFVDSQGFLEEYATWTYLDFENNTFPSFKRENGIITGIQVSSSHIFLTIPRLRPGVPATLVTLPRSGGPFTDKSLKPFPDWSWQHGFHDYCHSLVSVYRSRLDPCGRLWVLDTGSVNALCKFEQLCPPKLVVFNPDGSEAFRAVIPNEVLRLNSLLVSLSLDMKGVGRLQNCVQTNNLVVFISDIIPGVIVFDYQSQTFWRQEHPSMAPDPKFSNFTIEGENFYLEDGIVGMAVGVHQLAKVLFYQPLASKTVYAIQTSNLMNPEIKDLNAVSVFEKSSQSAGLIADGMSRLFYSQTTQTDVMEWNPILNRFRSLVVDSEKLQFVSDFSIDAQGSLWLISNKFHSYFNCNFSTTDINMRVMRIPRAANTLFV